jgi:pimeloyl-ACP methyl ester carboxylesterase
MPSPASWRATPPAGYRGPRIVLVHGLAAGNHMERHLLKFLRDAGYPDTTLYSNYTRPAVIAQDVAAAVRDGRPVALVGYSQGGFQLVKVAQALAQEDLAVDLLVTIAAGGGGRLYFPQWFARPRRIPRNVKRCLNFYAEGDWLGTDLVPAMNLAKAESAATQVENIAFPRDAGVDHIGIVRCYPAERVAPAVKTQLLDRLRQELAALTAAH